MAVKFRKNPAPLKGALFVSNPRKKKRRKPTKRRKNRLAISKRKNRKNPKRKNRLAMKRRNRRNPIHKRKNRLAMKRRNRLAMKRRNGTKKGMRRKTARRAYRRNPKSLLAPFHSQTFGGMKIKMLDKLSKQISDVSLLGVPVGKFGASVVQMASPTLFGMGSGLVMSSGADLLSKLPYIGGVFQGKFGVTFTGMALAMLSQYLPVSDETKKSLAIGFTVGAGAINGYQLVQESGGISQALMDLYPMSGVHLGNYGSVHLGDGMAYDVQPLSGVHHGALSGVHLQGHDSMYHDAKLSDSYLCPHDLSMDEGRSAIAGKQAYKNRFGDSPQRATQKSSSYSRHAGSEGHRWGWMIKILGFDRFQKLAQMSPSKRMKIIQKLKQSAMQHAKMEFDEQILLQDNSSPVSGLSMDMSGLSVDPMAGLVSIGAGI